LHQHHQAVVGPVLQRQAQPGFDEGQAAREIMRLRALEQQRRQPPAQRGHGLDRVWVKLQAHIWQQRL